MQARGTVKVQGDANVDGKMSTGQHPHHQHLNSTQANATTTALEYRAMNRPLYRGPISHNIISEMAEGFYVLSGGYKKLFIPSKDVYALMQNVGMHLTEEEFHDALRVIGQSEPQNADELSFSDFLLLMTREVDDTMADELRSAFFHYDKHKTGYVTRKQFTELFATLGERSTPEELEELLAVAEVDETDDKIDYNRFVNELTSRVNCM
ncbi:putative ef-hand protein 5 [Trypanosoma cruzi]|uniref:EF-hand protein 5, putative n=3 Tax=Trypanosoma cruzi TaxID=5693 RepID=Q4CSZ0_TRYCC|nr:EF-hand protein 5, putative [Trypanosoma cruzi]EAN83394.1 EF-hand protein 5, putative [Trypanosoma cruzi]KAF8277694.1 putative ef-hand protein 5 [Trypanosoma cruzi]PWV17886.1 putative ef-hand protein 5 [Trypanosoma cruzi]RNC44940.1 EF-hand protein 5 [Trypanosoma cruzi]RNF17014.1 EF-hand protein 5 [Trypanosoma cruzi]|eukprot:XP_805245.1 EF-hand protein 5 [Trypanosoma cruzi strain CL Brener]